MRTPRARLLLTLACSTALLACSGGAGDTDRPATDAGTTTAPGPGTDAPQTGTAPTTSGDATSDDPTNAPTSTAAPDGTGDAPDGTGDPSDATGDPGTTGDPGPFALPPPDGGFDYQLGGAYPPPDGVTIVERDRNASPEPGLYSICYVNGFQAQTEEADWWLSEHPDLILRDGNDEPIVDADWDEMLLDTGTPEKRSALAEIVGGWIAGCGAAGFAAVEIDNLDSFSRSTGLLDETDNVLTMAEYAAAAHAAGLAIAQKNATELLPRVDEMHTDFAVSEECSTYDECGDYVDVYGDAVLMVEYVQADFEAGCAAWPGHSLVLRDLDLVTPQDPGYVHAGC